MLSNLPLITILMYFHVIHYLLCISILLLFVSFSDYMCSVLGSLSFISWHVYPSDISRTMAIYPWQNSSYNTIHMFLDFLFCFSFFIRYCWHTIVTRILLSFRYRLENWFPVHQIKTGKLESIYLYKTQCTHLRLELSR